jgi:hypothetical protein
MAGRPGRRVLAPVWPPAGFVMVVAVVVVSSGNELAQRRAATGRRQRNRPATGCVAKLIPGPRRPQEDAGQVGDDSPGWQQVR